MTIPLRPAPRSTDESLLAKIRGGDRSAFEALFHSQYGALCSFAFRCTGSAELAEDVVQDVFLYVWKQRAALDVRGSLRTYLYSATRNTASDHLRHDRVMERTEPDVIALFDRAPVTPERAMVASEATTLLQRAIAKLPPRCRLVFTMQREQSMSYAEVAETLGISVKTVDVQMGRALKALRRTLGPDWP